MNQPGVLRHMLTYCVFPSAPAKKYCIFKRNQCYFHYAEYTKHPLLCIKHPAFYLNTFWYCLIVVNYDYDDKGCNDRRK